jgi:hypothetical protein
MAKSRTTFTKETAGKTRPRGKTKKTILLDALKAQAGMDEQKFYELMIERALNKDDPASSILIKEVLSRLYPQSKPTMPLVDFDLDLDSKAHEQVNKISDAIAKSLIPADVGKIMVDIIKASIEIEKATELAERIEAIERALDESDDSQ